MILAAFAIALTGLVAVPLFDAEPAHAVVIGDDYPAYLGNAAQDALNDPWRFFNRECTSFVAWRLNNVNGIPFSNYYAGSQAWGNANTWGVAAKAKGFRVDSFPAVGSVAWSTAGTYGHVAWVSAVLDDGRVVIEEYNWRVKSTDERGRYHTRIVAASSFTGYIHVRDLGSWPPVNNEFVRVAETGQVFRIAGGAPLYISSWAPFNPNSYVQTISAAQLNSLPDYPKDGTYIRGAESGRVYKTAMGAPIYVTSWAAVGGEKPYVDVNDATITNAGAGAPWNHLRAKPANGFIRDLASARVYRVADGHPYHVTSWTPYGGEKPFVDIDRASIDSCDHLNCDPWGKFDGVSGGSGAITVAGWTQDPNSSDPVTVRVSIDGGTAQTAVAGLSRKDVDAVYHHGSNRGYDAAFTASVGAHEVCVSAVNIGVGSDVLLGCRSVEVIATATAPMPVVTAYPTFTCDPGFAPGWLNEEGIPTSCVAN